MREGRACGRSLGNRARALEAFAGGIAVCGLGAFAGEAAGGGCRFGFKAGFHLQEIAGGWQFLTKSEWAPYIEKLYKPRAQQLSRAALETLAIIAYQQPVTRLEIDNIRQVKSDAMLTKLLPALADMASEALSESREINLFNLE